MLVPIACGRIVTTTMIVESVSWNGAGALAWITVSEAFEMNNKFRVEATILIILAGGHVRASAGALAVHTALIPCLCVCVCLSVCLSVCPVTNSSLITPRIGTKFVSVDR